MTVRCLVATLVLTASAAVARAQELSEDERIVHVLSRLTPGVTPELVAEVKAVGLEKWLDEQLRGGRPEPEALTARVARLESVGLSARELREKYMEGPGKNATPEEKKKAKKLMSVPADETCDWIVLRAVYSANPVRETVCDFFRNHFSVNADKKSVRYQLLDWERSVILARSMGAFGELLDATARHPAMLVFLDNAISRGPPTAQELERAAAAAKRKGVDVEEALAAARQKGLNENYARELMELHTLGVDNVYTQDDVIAVARCLTGWTLSRGDARGAGAGFRFDPRMHAAGGKTVLGNAIAEDRKTAGEGEQVLKILREHDGTARFLAWKLCRWLVNDTPDDAMVGRVAAAWKESGGDIPTVLRAIVRDPAFFDRANVRTKYKRPWEFAVSALRAVKAEITRTDAVEKVLATMNEPLYRCSVPTGYYDQAEAWRDPGSMATRWTFADDLVSGKIRGVRVPKSLYDGLDPAKPETWKDVMAARLLPGVALGKATSATLDETVRKEREANARVRPEQVGARLAAILLGSPEFQRQ